MAATTATSSGSTSFSASAVRPGGGPPSTSTLATCPSACTPVSVRPATANEPNRAGSWIVETDHPVWAAAPGQAAVLYDGDVVVGGGRIERATVSDAA